MKGELKAHQLPQKVECFTIEEAKSIFFDFFESRQSEADYFIFFPKNFDACEPVTIFQPGKYEIYCSSGVNANIIFEPLESGSYCLSAQVEENASLKRLFLGKQKDQIELKSEYTLKKNARLTHMSWIDSVSQTTESIKATIVGEGAEADLIGGWHLMEREAIRTTVLVEHRAAYARSNQLFKGVVEESARSWFEGSIYVAKGAHKTESFQKNNNVVFGRAQAKTAPGIQVYHDDVKASHGATIAKPSKEDLFYLLSRGVDENRAKQILIESFLGEIRGKIPFFAKRSA
ncbi:MAG: hypothetical protein EB053_03105 [Chlamydiae bacterium]|nr:hypothetical protein [Chlamydiota bacterium]